MQQATILGCGRQWRPYWAGCRENTTQQEMARGIATLPTRLGGLGLRSATRMAPAAFWASWANALPMLSQRLPVLTDKIMQSLDTVQDGGCLEQLQPAGFSNDRGGSCDDQNGYSCGADHDLFPVLSQASGSMVGSITRLPFSNTTLGRP